VNETINLGTGIGHRLIDLARALMEVTGIHAGVVVASAPSEDVFATLADTRRCEYLLRFAPTTDIHSLLERMVAAAHTPAMALS
jgi:UDP-glucose 4-epimerase